MALTRPKYSQIYDTDWKQSVELATTADVGNLVLANVQPNSIDGITVLTNYRILVKDQDSGAQNGIYLVRNAGTGSDGWWTRSLDALTSDRVTAGLTVGVVSGSVNGGKEFRLTTPDPITLGVTALTFINPFEAAQPGGANTYVQFNDTGSILGGSPGLTFNKFSNAVNIGGSLTTLNAGNISAGGYFLGNGSQLTGIVVGSSYSNVQVATYLPTYTGNVGKIYYDPNNGFVGFNDTSPDFVYDFLSPNDAGEILHIEGGVGTQAFFGARNSSGLNYAAGADQHYAFSGTIDTTNDYALKTNNIVRANIQGSSGNVIFTQSIAVAKDISATTLGIQEIRGIASNITVRSNITLLGTNLIGAGQLVIGTENLGAEALFVTGGETYLDGDVTVTGNLTVNGNTIVINANNLSINDSMIYLAEENPADTVDIGFTAHVVNPELNHVGFVRDATDSTWKLFSNVATQPTTTVDFTGANYANLLVGNIQATYFTGNGAFLTGLSSSYSNVQVATYLPTYSGVLGSSNLQVTGGGTFTGTLTVGAGGFINSGGNVISGGTMRDSKGDVRAAPINSQPGSYTAVAADAGKTIVESLLAAAITFNASVFAAGDMVSIVNTSAGNITLVQGTSVTLRLAGTATTGTRTLGSNGLATVICTVGGGTPTFYCSGAGLT